MTILVTSGTWNEGCFLTSAPSFPFQIQLTDVLIQQGHRENIITPSCSSHGNPGVQRKPTSRPLARRPFWRGVRSCRGNRPKSRYIYDPPKPTSPPDTNTSPPTPTMAFPGD